MNEGTNEERLPDVDVRPNAGIVRSPTDEIKALRTLLADVYKEDEDGRTLFRELVQNADDAGARRLGLTVLERGWPDARNSLLCGPALLVANDGAFREQDREALHKAIGGSKEAEFDKIGTFGVGLKSVFHICEAFLYMGAEESEWLAGVLNPWAGTGRNGDADPLHPDWNKVDGVDVERLRSVTTELLGEMGSGLLLWIPLRRHQHLDRGEEDHRHGLGKHCPKPDELCSWFKSSAPAALLLAQCGYLQAIETNRAKGPESLSKREKLMCVARQTSGWLRRYKDEKPQLIYRAFEGVIESGVSSWSVVGIESLGSESLRQLRSQSGWPQSPQWRNGRYSTVPRKALAHAAVTVLRPSGSDVDLSGTRLRWAAFLPLDDDPEPSSSAIVESKGSSPAWEIILHGYFWPSQDRKSIPGVTEDTGNTASDGGMRIRWNQALCEDLLLPLLPSALANAVVGVNERTARNLLDAVVDSNIVKSRLASVQRRHWLLPVATADGVRWSAQDANARSVLSIPKWRQAPEAIRKQFVSSCDEFMDDVVFIDEDAPRFAGGIDEWPVDHLEHLLNSIQGDVFASPQSLRWIKRLVRHVLGPDACSGDIRAAAFARWLAGQIGEDALAPTTSRSASRESREELRDAWRTLCAALPKAWLVETSVDSQKAVAELAAGGLFGEGVFPVPFGGESLPAPQLDRERLDRALSTMGCWLKAGGESERLRHSRLLLAEKLLSRRSAHPMGDLDGLPLLRAMRLPGNQEEAWSVVDLRRRIGGRRVFARPVSEDSNDGTEGARPERPSDPKQAVIDLAKAIGEAVWLVSGDAAASVAADVPAPAPEALASAVLRAKAFADPTYRKPLLRRLTPSVSDNADVRQAARVLLTGRDEGVVGKDAELFHDHAGNGQALRILLRLLDRTWCAVQGELVAPLPQDILEALSVRQADRQALHHLLDECLDKSVDWTRLSDAEAQHLLQQLHSLEPDAQRRWRGMPLHRGVDGTRGAFDHRARRSTGTTDELRLPPELEAKVRLLDPEPDITYLYDSVPIMDPGSVLRLMLEDSRPWCFAKRILCSIRPSEGSVILPQDGELRDLLRRSRWLPRRDGGGLAPDAVLVAPQELLDAVAGLAAAVAFGDKRLPEAVDSGIWRTAEPVVREILGRLSHERQVQRIADALDSDRGRQVDRGAWLVIPDPDRVDASLIEDALQTALAGSHPGWKVVHVAACVVGHGAGRPQDSSEPLVKLTKALCAPIPLECQIEMLTSLAGSRPAKDSPGGRMFRKYLEFFADADGFFKHVLPKLDLPTQDGNWHTSQDVARTETGVARRHRLVTELRPILRLSGDDPVNSVAYASGAESNPSGTGLDILEQYFEPWRYPVPHGAVGAFLSLLGNGLHNAIRDLAQQWLGEDVAIEPIGELDRRAVSVWVSPKVVRGDRVSAVNVLGSMVEMEAEADDDTLFAIDPVRHPRSQYSALAPLGEFWGITLRDVEPQSRSSSELVRLLGGTVERWASRYLGLPREQVNTWWSRWGEGSQADLGPVLASIKAHLPLTLQQIDVKESKPLRRTLREAERAQRKREQAPSDETLKIERKGLDRLATLIEDPEQQPFLWKRVNTLMRRYGYEEDSVLLELAQNA